MYTNRHNISLPLAVFLVTDNYDFEAAGLSATTLLKPIRQLILANRVPAQERVTDIYDNFKNRLGAAIHDGIENAWKKNHVNAMRLLGYSDHIIDTIKINPDPDTVTDDDICVYLEQRFSRELMGVKITGKSDIIADGGVGDYKSTSVFVFMNGVKDDDFRMQGSIYRWLAPKIITKDELTIYFILMDWNAAQARREHDKGYPQTAIIEKRFPLYSLQETEAFIRKKLIQLDMYKDAVDDDIPECTSDDLWRSEPVYKYYKNPQKIDKSTKNFSTYQEAHQRWMDDGQVGLIKSVPGLVKACHYCPAAPICKQRERLIASGELSI